MNIVILMTIATILLPLLLWIACEFISAIVDCDDDFPIQFREPTEEEIITTILTYL